MNITDFLKEHGLNCRTPEEQDMIFRMLDKLYIEMQPEQAVRLVLDYFDRADELYNESPYDSAPAEEKVLADCEEK